jgi:hypothetical protein
MCLEVRDRDELAKHQRVTDDGPRFVHCPGLGKKHGRLLNSSFHEKLYNRSPAHTTPAAGLASSGHVASLATALAAEASLDPR